MVWRFRFYRRLRDCATEPSPAQPGWPSSPPCGIHRSMRITFFLPARIGEDTLEVKFEAQLDVEANDLQDHLRDERVRIVARAREFIAELEAAK